MAADVNKPDTPVRSLRDFTSARIGLGKTGVSMPLHESLAFKLAHAHARDAVYSRLDVQKLVNDLEHHSLPVLQVHSQAGNRYQYLQRPDLGRRLDEESTGLLENYKQAADVVIILSDGLSADALNLHGVPLLSLLLPKLLAAGLVIGPIVLVQQGRVAIGDDIGYALGARLSLILIGERPGLSSADSMGAYFTFNPRHGLTDDARNCISNIRPDGLKLPLAADKILYLLQEALRLQLTGVALKDNAGLLAE